MTGSIFLAYGAIFISIFIWGGVYSVKVPLLNYFTPIEIVFYQSLFASIIICILSIILKKRIIISIKKALHIIVSGIIGIALFQILINIGIDLVGSTVSSVFTGIIPALCLICDYVIWNKKTNISGPISILISFVGIVFVAGSFGFENFNYIGYGILLLSDIVWIYFCYFNSRAKFDESSFIVLFYQLVGTSLFILPYILLRPLDINRFFNTDVMFRFIFLSLINGVVAYVLLIYALKNISVFIVNILNNFIPIITMIVNYIFFDERILLLQKIGVVMVVISAIIPSINFKITFKIPFINKIDKL